jgi:predicted TIM-barrel fold metal-dependent hydrolase
LPFSRPFNLYQPATDFPQVPIIIAHAGALFLYQESFLLAKEFPNIFIETSVPYHNSRTIRSFVRGLGARRVLMGSGSPQEMQHTLWKHRSDPQTRLKESELSWCLGKNAIELFKLDMHN